MRNRLEELKTRNFNIVQENLNTNLQEGYSGYQRPQSFDFSKIKVGTKSLEDAILDLGTLRKINPRLADRQTILRAIDNYDLKTMREVSNFFYRTSGIYVRILRYMAFMYRYDWFVSPVVPRHINLSDAEQKKMLEVFSKCLDTLDSFNVKRILSEIALQVLKNGAYYGYKVKTSKGYSLQELPVNYCRSRYFCGDKPAVEFNMKFFDDSFMDTTQRMKMLKMFPPEFMKGYSLYKRGKLKPEYPGDENGWYLLDVKMTERFTANGEEYPMFISVIPLILDLDEAQELDKRKTMQRLLKIVIQKMPIDKNGDLIFDPEEAQQLHNNAVQMLGQAIGVDVLTTFADVEVEGLSDTSAAANQTDDLERVERQLYNDVGIPKMLFNTDGNIALEKSILNDAASMKILVLQFEEFLNELIEDFNTHKKKFAFKAQILGTTIYNYQEMAKLYKEQTQLGYSKMLPQIALGQSQSSVLSNAFFENDVLDLVNVFIPPLMSSTMNENVLNRVKGQSGDPTSKGETAGRKELPDDQKSEKTIMNKESQS